jgi:hypothetical protein
MHADSGGVGGPVWSAADMERAVESTGSVPIYRAGPEPDARKRDPRVSTAGPEIDARTDELKVVARALILDNELMSSRSNPGARTLIADE